MRRELFLTLILVLGLLIFSGCEMADNPMEVESTFNSSTEMVKASEDTSNQITVKVINPNSNGNLILKFFHVGHMFELESMKIDNHNINIISSVSNPVFSTTLVVIEIPTDFESGVVTFEFNFIIDDIPIDIIFDSVFDEAESGIGDAIAFGVDGLDAEVEVIE